MASTSKIAQLPRKVRDELCQRMDDGQLGPEVLPWLNALPVVRELVETKFNKVAISDQNLSEWRHSGFKQWQEQQRELGFISNATAFSKDVVKHTGLRLTEGAAAIAAGAVLTRLEDFRRKQLAGELVDEVEIDAKIAGLIEMLTPLRGAEIAREHNELQRDKGVRESAKVTLAREKFEFDAAKAVLKHAATVQSIAKSGGNNAAKIAELRKLMFPQRAPTTTPPTTS